VTEATATYLGKNAWALERTRERVSGSDAEYLWRCVPPNQEQKSCNKH
jgi:hypothetical protein